MASLEFSISKIGSESEGVLRALLDEYVSEMAEWFPMAAKAGGSCSYDMSSIWSNGCDVYLARAGETPAGFAIVGRASRWAQDARDVHEFFVARGFRRMGLGHRLATLVWDECRGEWLVRVLEANTRAVAFWRMVIGSYPLSQPEEERRIVDGRPWRFFRFVSRPRA